MDRPTSNGRTRSHRAHSPSVCAKNNERGVAWDGHSIDRKPEHCSTCTECSCVAHIASDRLELSKQIIPALLQRNRRVPVAFYGKSRRGFGSGARRGSARATCAYVASFKKRRICASLDLGGDEFEHVKDRCVRLWPLLCPPLQKLAARACAVRLNSWHLRNNG